MRKFACTRCRNPLYFDNSACLKCGAPVGFDPAEMRLVALSDHGSGSYRKITRGGGLTRYCANAAHGVCNWLTANHFNGELCAACQLNRTIPNLSEPGNVDSWRDLENAKRRLVYSLLRFRLPMDGGGSAIGPLAFDFVAGASTGHLDGVITIDLSEANSLERERQRLMFDERYRTLLGHLRHESGHYSWMLLIESAGRLDAFRALFGDERPDYGQALSAYHANGAPADWPGRYVSRYASAHPWEDWAETWAHYLHMVDAVDSAEALGMEPRASGILGSVWPFNANDVYLTESFDALMERWVPLSLALNSLNRSMGHPDFYPFVIPQPAVAKLAFVHRVVREEARKRRAH